VIPGIGPAVTLPAAVLMPENPSWDFVRNQVMPFGEADTGSGILETFLPSYLRKMQTAFNMHPSGKQQRQLISTSRDVMAYLYSTGDYDISTAAGQQKLLDDAKGKARLVFVVRALAQSSAPSSPAPVFAAKDRDGRLHALYAMQADYRRMQNDPRIGYQKATEAFLAKYGDFAFLVTIPKTAGDVAPTETVNRFARAHPDQAKRYPSTFGLFTPGGEIDPAEIDRQIVTGTRQATTPEQAVELANIRMANAIYQQAKAGNADPVYLRAVKAKLSDKYPGYTGMPNNLAKGAGTIAELQRASQDPTLARTDAGQGLSMYLAARDQATAVAQAGGLGGFQSAKRAQPLRDWLTSVAAKITEAHPDFGVAGGMWDRVLSRETETP
jgi:hypothetical protein